MVNIILPSLVKEVLSFNTQLISLEAIWENEKRIDHKIPAGFLAVEEPLLWKKEPENSFDKNAVQVLKGDDLLGYVKLVHSGLFYKPGGDQLKIFVKNINQNGLINRIFIRLLF